MDTETAEMIKSLEILEQADFHLRKAGSPGIEEYEVDVVITYKGKVSVYAASLEDAEEAIERGL